jgi:hypothetical protein
MLVSFPNYFLPYIILAGWSESATSLMATPSLMPTIYDFWIRTQSAAVASWHVTDLANHPSKFDPKSFRFFRLFLITFFLFAARPLALFITPVFF